jgi:hypothetical protein
MDDNADYDFVYLAEGNFPELAREISEKRAEATSSTTDTASGAVTDSLLDPTDEPSELFGAVQRAAAVAGLSRQWVFDNLDRRTLLKGFANFSFGAIGGTWAVNKLGLDDIGKSRYELPANNDIGKDRYQLSADLDYSSLWSALSNDKRWLADQLEGSSPDADAMATIRHLLFMISKHGNSFTDTDHVISLYDKFLSENSEPNLVQYLTYRKAIDYRYLGFPDTSFEITKNIDLGKVNDKKLRCYIADNFHLQCTQNDNCGKPISEIISENCTTFLDFHVSDFSSENWSNIYRNYGSRGLLQVKDFIVNLIRQVRDQSEAWLIYEEYRRFATFCMTLDGSFERDADRVPIASFLIPIWGTSAIVAKFLSQDWPRINGIFADVYGLGFAPDGQKQRLQIALDEQRSKQSSPVIIQLALLKAIFDKRQGRDGLDSLEMMLPNYAESLRKKRYSNSGTEFPILHQTYMILVLKVKVQFTIC